MSDTHDETIELVVNLPTTVRVVVTWNRDGMAEIKRVVGRAVIQPTVTAEDVTNALDPEELIALDREPEEEEP